MSEYLEINIDEDELYFMLSGFMRYALELDEHYTDFSVECIANTAPCLEIQRLKMLATGLRKRLIHKEMKHEFIRDSEEDHEQWSQLLVELEDIIDDRQDNSWRVGIEE